MHYCEKCSNTGSVSDGAFLDCIATGCDMAQTLMRLDKWMRSEGYGIASVKDRAVFLRGMRALEAQLAAQTVGITALREVRQSLQFANDSPNGPIRDTIWMMHGPETLFDYIDAALASAPAPAAGQEDERCANCGLHCKPAVCIYGTQQAGALTDERAHEILIAMSSHVDDWAERAESEPSPATLSKEAIRFILAELERAQ
jgi:hypothetical protein